ncbi:MAG TPA: hypothetical protein VMG08_15695 [Allosphingosinicella sp.]|nr:hypothetical protein [Allosphingosinicella sp.]
MRKLLISAALATATIATAVPSVAMAQPGYGWQRGGPTRPMVANLLRDLNQAEQRINRAPGISRREAMSLRREAANIRNQLNRAHRNGINQREFNILRGQVNRLQQRVRMENRDRDNRRY